MAQPRRIELQAALEEMMGNDHVYFQPPETFKMKYPAIIYHLSGVNHRNADDETYALKRRYDVTIIDRDPDSELPDKLLAWKYCRLNRFYTADGLNHWAFGLYY